METKYFTVRMPAELVEALDDEARREFFKQNGRNQMLIKILANRYSKLDTQINEPLTADAPTEAVAA